MLKKKNKNNMESYEQVECKRLITTCNVINRKNEEPHTVAEYGDDIMCKTYITSRYKIEVIESKQFIIKVDFLDFYFFLLAYDCNMNIETNIPFTISKTQNINIIFNSLECILSFSNCALKKYLNEKCNLIFTLLLNTKCFQLIQCKRLKVKKLYCDKFIAKSIIDTNYSEIGNYDSEMLEIFEEFKLNLCNNHFALLSIMMYAKHIRI